MPCILFVRGFAPLDQGGSRCGKAQYRETLELTKMAPHCPYLYATSVWNPSMLPVSPWPWIELNFTSKIS